MSFRARDTFAAICACLLSLAVAGCATSSAGFRTTPGSGGGVSLARDWAADAVEGQLVASMTLAQLRRTFDTRYLKLTGGTLTGALTVANQLTISGLAPTTLRADIDANWLYVNGGLRAQANFYVDGTITGITSINSSTFFKSTGVDEASLPTCNAGSAGSIETGTNASPRVRPFACAQETTSATYTWLPLVASHTLSGSNVNTTNTVTHTVARTYLRFPSQADELVWVPQTAGVGAGVVTLRLIDNVGSTVCSDATFGCATAPGNASAVVKSCAAAVLSAGIVRLEVDGTACATAPQGTLTLSYR